jgi:hypothetical protein
MLHPIKEKLSVFIAPPFRLVHEKKDHSEKSGGKNDRKEKRSHTKSDKG